jgi:hypothetical protein
MVPSSTAALLDFMDPIAVAIFPIEYDVTLAELRAKLRKKGFRSAANADASQIRLSWTANAEDCVRLPDATTEASVIKAGSFITIDVAA